MRVVHPSRAVALLATAALGLASGAPAQSLAEIAAKQKEKRKGKPTKVFTEEDLRRGSSGAVTADAGAPVEGEPAAVPSPGAAPAPNAPAQPTEEEQRAEQQKAWRDKLQKSRDNVTQLDAEVNRLQTALNDIAEPLYGATRANRMAALEKAKQQLASAQQAVVDLEEQGRRSGYR
jgi:hypothetical protein